jgi:chromosome segregation ATPase
VELAKYEMLINDLNSLESQIVILKNKYNDTNEKSNELEVSLNEVQEDRLLLRKRISELETEINKIKKNSENINLKSLTLEERDSLKSQIKDLVKRIDHHLSVVR